MLTHLQIWCYTFANWLTLQIPAFSFRTTRSSAEVKERVELYLYSHSGLSWPVLGRTLPLPLPPGLTFSNPTFCPHSVFMCFVCISEQRAIIILYSINWLVCITEMECVYCAVRTVFMCFVWISEQTAIIWLYRINWLICMTGRDGVYCMVRTEYLKPSG
jgi:hypothetical protein